MRSGQEEVYAKHLAPTGGVRYRGVSYRRPIDAAKELVPILDLAERLCGPGMRRGGEVYFRCPLHDDHDPSLRADPEKGVWYCDPCSRGGDAVELYRLANGFDEREAGKAAGYLLLEFGHEPPKRPEAWYRKQQRQRRTRNLIWEARVDVLTRRLWRRVFGPIVAEIEDETERTVAARALWPRVVGEATRILQERT